MSTTYLCLVSLDPEWTPQNDEQIEKMVALAWEAFPDSEEIEPLTHKYLAFVHPFENLQSVTCPNCNTGILEWFWELIDDESYQGEALPMMNVEYPCCKKFGSLAELIFHWPATFAKFQLDVMNPEVDEFPTDLVARLESITGQKFGGIWAYL